MPSIGSPWWTDEIYRDGQGGVWLNPYKSDEVFYYDHEGIKKWSVSSWLGQGAYLLDLGSTSSGWHYCVGSKRVMIW